MEDDLIVPQGPNPRNLPPIPVKAGETVAWSVAAVDGFLGHDADSARTPCRCDWAMARLPEIWGEDCENFNPERFLVKDEATGKLSFIQHGQVSDGTCSCQAETRADSMQTVPQKYKFHVFNR